MFAKGLKDIATAGCLLGCLSIVAQPASAASCSASGTHFTLNPTPSVAALECGPGNVNGKPGHDAIVDLGYVLIDGTDTNSGALPGSLMEITNDETSGTWRIDIGQLAGYQDFVIALKAGNGWGAFSLNGATSGTWSISKELSHANLYAKAVPLPAAAWLFGSALLGMIGLGYRRKNSLG